MKISVFGLGYVGCVSAVCLAARGHEVVGVDVQQTKVDLINGGTSTVVEELIGELTSSVVRAGALRATTDVDEAARSTDVCMVCVGTPSAPNGSLSTAFLTRVAEQIGSAIAASSRRHTIVFRSTMLPGTCDRILIPILEKHSGRQAGVDFGVAINPEYLREGSSVRDFDDPPKTVIGQLDEESGNVLEKLYDRLPGDRFRVPLQVAEMTKYVDNAYHALKVGFANEIGAICQSLAVDSAEVMNIFLADRKLNVSPAYLRPGFAFGGSCLPKDLRGLVYAARQADVSVPILENILPSNDEHIRRAFEIVTEFNHKRIGLFGLAFKEGTDDLRESPLVELAERLLGKGYELRIYDSNVSVSRLLGANRDFLEDRLPHVGRLLANSVDEVLDHSDVCVIGCTDPDVLVALESAGDRPLVDLVRVPDNSIVRRLPNYRGIGWA